MCNSTQKSYAHKKTKGHWRECATQQRPSRDCRVILSWEKMLAKFFIKSGRQMPSPTHFNGHIGVGRRHPGAAVCEWLKSGANAVLITDPCGVGGIFPCAGEEDEPDATFDDDFTAHSCGADDDEAAKQIRLFADRGWLEETPYARLQSKFGNDFTVSDFCVVVKEKQGKIKRRLILDLKRSGISRRTRKNSSRCFASSVRSGQSCATPVVNKNGKPRSRDLRSRLHRRVLANSVFGGTRKRSFCRLRRAKTVDVQKVSPGFAQRAFVMEPSTLLIRCTQSVFSGMSHTVNFLEARNQWYVDDPAITR